MVSNMVAKVLAGASPLTNGGINDTYRGQILIKDGISEREEVSAAYIKDLDECQLINELIIYDLAVAVGLPVPKSYLAAAASTDLQLKNGPSCGPGMRFAFASIDKQAPSIYFKAQSLSPAQQKILADEICEWEKLGQLYAFDTWVANIDRHAGNLLVKSKEEFWLIDHGHCLTGPNWDASSLVPAAKYINRLSEWITVLLDTNQRQKRCVEAENFETELSKINISKLLTNSVGFSLLEDQKKSAVEKFIGDRTALIAPHSKDALGVII